MSDTDTIFAPATLMGQSGVAVVRVSGPDALTIASAVAPPLPTPRHAALRTIRDPATDAILDEGLVITFTEGASFTGEPIVEFQVHGSVAVVDMLCDVLGRFEDCRPARHGEFTRRAFSNGRIDLIQAEGLADLISAETQEQHKLAQQVLSGEVSRETEAWREALLGALALVEASIDFADEEIPPGLTEEVTRRLRDLEVWLDKAIDGYQAARRIRDGLEVAIVGEPNVGKSTLLNHLSGRDAALTSEVAGTTRDVLEVRMNIAGRLVTFLDTAGVRETADHIETLGIERAISRARQADLRIFLVWEDRDIGGIAATETDIVVMAKRDLRDVPGGEFGVSGVTGEGMDELLSLIETRVVGLSGNSSGISHLRQRTAVATARDAVRRAIETLREDPEVLEISSEHLRKAVSALDSLVGRIDVEDVLGQIFSRFCIGK